MTVSANIVPVILSGGSGSRLWPLSRENYPKQLLPLVSERSMLQETVARVLGRPNVGNPIVVCNEAHRFIIGEQLQQMGCTPETIVLEPCGRNTAPAIAIAAELAREKDPDCLLLILPADHHMEDAESFGEAVDRGCAAARQGALVTFGVEPTGPNTGYGYIRRGEAWGDSGVFRVARFVEKPPADVAEAYVASGEYFWNGGMFLFRAATVLEELERFEPGVLSACRDALAKGRRDLDFLRLDEASFAASPTISIDYAVMERTANAAVVPLRAGWTDIGAWSALWEIGRRDENGNIGVGDVVFENSQDCYVRSEGMLTGVVGLKDAVVVVMKDAVLVTDRAHAQNVKRLVERLKESGRPQTADHRVVHRPWGAYETLHNGDRFQVKAISVKPGRKLSLQKHFHRAEHWVVVTGTAIVTRDDETLLVRENESVYLPLGCVHRLENPGKVMLNLIEVQSGPYLGEDDIVRIEDDYRRV